MKNTMFRQGDLLIEVIDAVPAGAVKQTGVEEKIILAYGEVTGHHHSIDINDADWWKDGTDSIVKVKRRTAIVHQEHDPIPLSKGQVVRVTRQREFAPEAPRQVAD